MINDENEYIHYNRITNYEDFVDYCLRKLGAPVIDINLDPEQIQDRITDALQYYLEYDLESVMECWWLHRVTKEDAQNGFLKIPLEVLDVMDVYTPSNDLLYSDSESLNSGIYNFGFMENPQWQWFNDFWRYGNYFSGSMTMFYFEVSMQYISMLQNLFTAKVEFMYRRRQRKLALYSKNLIEGQVYCLYGTKILDPETDDCIWDSDFLKNYATALLGVQWGKNLSKFGNIPSAANLTISGDSILQTYQQEKQELEDLHNRQYREPPLPMFG